MPITVKIPTPLRPLAGGKDEVSLSGGTVRQILEGLERECPGIRSRICDDRGDLRRFVNLFLNDEDVRHLQGLDTSLKDGDVISVVPAIAGGACASGSRGSGRG
jgi:sulfur-carrier protein